MGKEIFFKKDLPTVLDNIQAAQPDITLEVRVRDALSGLRREMPEYKAWEQMKQRCRNIRYSTWKNYGGRGIKVCDEWLNDFPAFYEHIGPKPQPYDKYSLDRIDNDGNYEPGNVRWATRYQQQKNRRLHKDNKSGASGITWSDKKNGWSVFDFRDDKSHYIGFYPLLGKAIDALVEYRVKLELAQEANKADGCPCLLVEPCSYACSCAKPIMSGGCMRCAKYGSKEQRLKAAQRLAQLTADKEQA